MQIFMKTYFRKLFSSSEESSNFYRDFFAKSYASILIQASQR